jgi:hypothetical protein
MYESIGFIEDEDNDKYPGKAGLFWMRHEHFLAENRVNCEFYNPLTTSDMLRVFMGSTSTIPRFEF